MKTKKSMKSSIRAPFLWLIIIMPLSVILLFNISIRAYMTRYAKSGLVRAIDAVEAVVSREFRGNIKNFVGQKADRAFLRLNAALKVNSLSSDIEVLLFDRQHTLIYPDSEGLGFITAEFVKKIGTRINSLEPDEINTLYYSRERFFASAYPLLDMEDGPVLVFVARTSSMAGFVRVVNLFLFVFLLAGAVTTFIISGRITRRISRPVTELSELTKKVAKGQFDLPDTNTDILELEALHDSIRDMAEQLADSDKAQKTFLQNASHELKTPLMSIQGYAEGIVSGVIPDTNRAAKIISEESVKLNSLVAELLTLTRIEGGGYPAELVMLSLNDELKELAQRLGGIAAKSSKELILNLPEENITAPVDEALLSQAMMNIVSNCLRYAKTSVKISVFKNEKAAVIRVEDDGPGIAPKDLAHIFERFYKGAGGNFGLGLAIAKSAAELMGGKVYAGGGKDGAVFELTLPLKKL